jgi:Pectate lyase superfamily protein
MPTVIVVHPRGETTRGVSSLTELNSYVINRGWGLQAGDYADAYLAVTGQPYPALTDAGADAGAGAGGGSPVFDVRGYGAKGDGTADDRPAIQAAVDAATAATAAGRGAVVQLAPGVHRLGSAHPAPPASHGNAHLGVRLPVNLPAGLVLRGHGAGVTTIRLSDAARCAFWIGQDADHDTFRNVTIEDLDVDNADTAGRCHVLIGSMPEYQTTQKNLNFADLTFRRLRTYGYHRDLTQATQDKAFIALVGDHPDGAPGGTRTSTRNVTVEDLRMTDVQHGVLVHTRHGNGATDHWYDAIRIARCSHRITAFPGQILDQSSYFVCGAGLGGSCEIVDCESVNVGDDGVEVGAMQRVLIDRFRVVDPFLLGVYVRQAQAAPDPDAQTITIRDYAYTGTAGLNGGAGNPVTRPLSFVSDDPGAHLGGIDLVRPVISYDGVRVSKLSRGSEHDMGLLLAAPARRILVDGLRLQLRGLTFDNPWSDDYNVVQVNLYPPQLENPVWQYSPGQCILRDCEVVVTHAVTTTTGLVNLHLLWPVGQGLVDVDGLVVQVDNLTVAPGGGGGLNLVQVGRGGSLGLLRLSRVRPVASNVPMRRNGIVLNDAGGWQGLDVDACDWRSWTTDTGADLDTGAAPADYAARLLTGPSNRGSH